MAKSRGRNKTKSDTLYVRWNGNGPMNFPYLDREVVLKPGTNKITQKQFDGITGGLDSEGRARGGSAAEYVNMQEPMLLIDNPPLAGDDFHVARETVGITKSARTKSREAESKALKDELAQLRLTVADLQTKAAAKPKLEIDPGEMTGSEVVEAAGAMTNTEIVDVLAAEIRGRHRKTVIEALTKAITSTKD